MTWLARGLVLVGLLLVLGLVNYDIYSKQRIVDTGREVLLRLRPVDPRSLIQGDYMVLRYDTSLFPKRDVMDRLPYGGHVVLKLDADNVATFTRLDDGTALADDEVRLRFRHRSRTGELRYGAESFFFQEGEAKRFSKAKFGVLHLNASGNSVLVAVADEKRAKIPPK